MEVKLLIGNSREELEKRIKIIASAGKLSRFEGDVFEVLDSSDDYKKNLMLIKRIIGMGHESIVEHDYLVFAIKDVSPIVEQTLIGSRLASFTIKSRREVDFSNVGFYTPEFRSIDGNVHENNEKLKSLYNNHMKYLFDEYSYFVENGVNKEDSRFVLPYSYHSNIIMGLDSRELKKLIDYLLNGDVSNIQEIKELALAFNDIVKEHIPYLNIKEENKTENPLNIKFKDTESSVLEKPKLIDYTENSDNIILSSYIMTKYQCTFEKSLHILEELSKEDPDFKYNLMKHIVLKKENRELEQVNFRFQIPISLAILTHITRHRMHSLLTPDFVPIWNLLNYTIPDDIKAFDLDRYERIYEKNNAIFEHFKNMGVKEEDLVYFYLSGHNCNILTKMDGRALQWICEKRCCNKAQWQIRNIMNEAAQLVKEISPIFGEFIGPFCKVRGYCPEGKESCKKKVM